ncbi:MAG: hypothetical protein VCF08_20370 [Alphaproteobacteria bacterium]
MKTKTALETGKVLRHIFRRLPEGDIDDIMWAINSTPRKCLGYRTPAEAFLENLTIALEM